MLTAGTASDAKAAPVGRARQMHCLRGDKGHEADRLRRMAAGAGTIPVIPGRRDRKSTTRYDELAANFLSGVKLAAALASRDRV